MAGKYLFQGGSCYPLSPKSNMEQNFIDKDDQLIKILEHFPNIDDELDFSFVKSDNTQNYL